MPLTREEFESIYNSIKSQYHQVEECEAIAIELGWLKILLEKHITESNASTAGNAGDPKQKLTVERVKGMIQKEMEHYDAHAPTNAYILKQLLKEINEAENDARTEA